jgi:hypothetical protein
MENVDTTWGGWGDRAQFHFNEAQGRFNPAFRDVSNYGQLDASTRAVDQSEAKRVHAGTGLALDLGANAMMAPSGDAAFGLFMKGVVKVVGPAARVIVKSIWKGEVNGCPTTLIHYTTETPGLPGITEALFITASKGAKNARHGNGVYLTDIFPEMIGEGSGKLTLGQVMRRLFGQPWGKQKSMGAFVELNVQGLELTNPKPNIFLYPTEEGLDVSGRIVRSGKTF